MPPKSKKQQQEEAQRLLEQQKKKQEQEARLAQERKKYAGQKIKTGLYLPVSAQLIFDFFNNPLAVIEKKIQQNIVQEYPKLKDNKIFKNLLIREITYYILNACKIFQFKPNQQNIGQINNIMKIRALIGISLAIMLHQHTILDGKGKSKIEDKRLFRQLLSRHAVQGTQKLQIYLPEDLIKINKILTNGYFNHFLLIQNYQSFPQRFDQRQQIIYVCSPCVSLNTKQTNFTDLSQKAKQNDIKS